MGDGGGGGASYICTGSHLAPAVTQVAVAYGKDLWKKRQIPVTMKFVKDACAEVYVVLIFDLLINARDEGEPGCVLSWRF